jgi:hypothetical protein
LTRHDKTVHLKLREHVCEVCGRAFGENGTFRCTFACKHDKVRSAPCFQCGKTYSSDSNLMSARPHCARRRDRQSASVPQVRLCGRPPVHLRIHFTAAHTSNRFQCAYGCPHGYTPSAASAVHLKEKHRHKRKRYIMLALHKDAAKPALPENDTLPHKCEMCEWRFPNLAFLAMHIKAKHC